MGGAIRPLAKLVMGDTADAAEGRVHLAGREDPAIGAAEGVPFTAVDEVAAGDGFDVVADLVTHQGEVRIRERRDQQLADAVGRSGFQERGLRARAHDAVRLDEQVAGLAGAVEVDHRHAEDPFHDGAVRDAGELVARQDEPQGREASAVALAMQGEPSAVHRVDVEEGGLPGRDFVGHDGQLVVAEAEGDARLIDVAAVAEGALFEVEPAVVAADAAATRRREDGAAEAGPVAEALGDERIPEQGAKLLFGPPGLAEHHAHAGAGSAGGALFFDQAAGQERFDGQPGRQEAFGRVFAQLALRDAGKVGEQSRAIGKGCLPVVGMIERHPGGQGDGGLQARGLIRGAGDGRRGERHDHKEQARRAKAKRRRLLTEEYCHICLRGPLGRNYQG